MKLYCNTTSPYARKAKAFVIETGLSDRVEFVTAQPFQPDSTVPEVNPLGKVPALVLDDGSTLFDSPLICEYLNSVQDGESLFPAEGAARWRALRRQALGDGIIDAAVTWRCEGLFHPEEHRSAAWIGRQQAAIARGLDVLEAEARQLDGPVTIGHLAIACALGYLDFRFEEVGWRQGRPALARWYEGFAKRPAMQQTMPRD